MSKFFEAVTEFQHALNSYAEDDALLEVVLAPQSFHKIKWVLTREIELGGTRADQVFGFEELLTAKPYFKCRGIKFVRGKI